MRNMLLLYRRVSFGVDEGWVCHEVPPVLHDKAPARDKQSRQSPVRLPWALQEHSAIKHHLQFPAGGRALKGFPLLK